MKKNILYLHAGAELYGADKVLLELVSGVDKEKYTPHVILPTNGLLVEEMIKRNITVSVLNYPILRRRIFNFSGMIKYCFSLLKYSLKLTKYVKDNKIELVHINTTAVLEGIFISKINKIPLLWHVHEIITKPRFVYKLTSLVVNLFSDEVITVSEATKKHLINSGNMTPNKISVIYNGVNKQEYNNEQNTSYLYKEFNIPNNAKVLGMIGRVNSWKGQKDFIKAVEPILMNNNSVYALLVGGIFEGEERFMNELTEMVKNSPAKNQIRISDFRTDIANIHNMFDIFILPSTNPDPLPTVVLEAMASQKPIVGYNHGGIMEMVQDKYNGLLVEPGNIRELENKIRFILENENERLEMGDNSLKRQEKLFDKQIYIKNFEKKYFEMIGRSE